MDALARNSLLLAACLVPLATLAAEKPEPEVRRTFEAFVAAQNAHDARAVADLLWDGPGFVWITRGNVIWGRDAAVKRFEANYAGTWKLEPDLSQLRVTALDGDTAQLFVPLTVISGPAGQPPQPVAFHMNQVLLRTPAGWKVTAILPIPAPKP